MKDYDITISQTSEAESSVESQSNIQSESEVNSDAANYVASKKLKNTKQAQQNKKINNINQTDSGNAKLTSEVVPLISKFEFECLMQGYRLDPQENDDNNVPDTCEVGFETTIHSNNVIQLIWTSHPIEIVKVENH